MLVEFAIIAPVFVLLIIAVIELSMMYFANLTMQHAVREGARYSITGHTTAEVIQKIKDSSMGMYAKVNPVITVNGNTTVGPTLFGAAGDIAVISLDCSWTLTTPMMKVFFKDGKAHFVVAATMRNEYFNG